MKKKKSKRKPKLSPLIPVTGRTLLHQWLNAYLTKQFVTSDAPPDECESEANEIIDQVAVYISTGDISL